VKKKKNPPMQLDFTIHGTIIVQRGKAGVDFTKAITIESLLKMLDDQAFSITIHDAEGNEVGQASAEVDGYHIE
jgi:hypothetical protein